MGVDSTVKGVLLAHSTLSGLFVTPDGASLQANDRCLVTGQNNPLHNGIYIVSNGAWAYDLQQHMFPGLGIRVYAGGYYKHSEWLLANEAEFVQGSVAQIWTLNSLRGAGVPSSGFERESDTGSLKLMDSGVVPGSYVNPKIVVSADGRIRTAEDTLYSSTYIEGLSIYYESPTVLGVMQGAAYIPGTQRIVEYSGADLTLTGLPIGVWHYVYLHEVNSIGQLHVSTTAPDPPYFITASTKAGDANMRYVGRFWTISTGIDFKFVQSVRNETVQGMNYTPVGVVFPYAGDHNEPPNHWMMCNGAEISRTTYAALFNAIGTAFGNGDGSTTFKIPDLVGRVPVGAEAGVDTEFNRGFTGGSKKIQLSDSESGLRNHNHPVDRISNVPSGGNRDVLGAGTGPLNTGSVNSQNANSGHQNMPPYQVLGYIIRYD